MKQGEPSSYEASMGPRIRPGNGWAALGLALTLASCRSTTHLRTQVAVAPAAAELSSERPAFGATDIDRAFEAEWKRRGIVASPPVDDERFLRRVTLDIIGRIPKVEEIERFASDPSVDRRAAVVQSLIASPEYADHWTNYWEDVLLLEKTKAKFVDRDEFRAFLHGAFVKNLPWSDVVHELVDARGLNRPATEAGAPTQVDGAVNWLLQYRDNPQDLAGKVASTFLGVKIQCAQCHDHKTEKWKQKDFVSFAACFARMKATPLDSDSKLGPVALYDANGRIRRPKKPDNASIASAAPAALDGTDFSNEDDRREALADWTTSSQNPWFAKAFVNRIWGYFLGRGFVEPVDDFRASNPGEMPELLDQLAKDFAAHGYDTKRLIALIATTEVYQLSASAPDGAKTGEIPLWSRYPLKPLAPDELLDSIAIATDLDDVLGGQRGTDELEKAKAQLRKQFDFLFDVDEESHTTTYEGTIPQALMLMNGRQVNRTMRVGRHGALLKVLAMPSTDENRVEALFLRTVSRKPTPDETKAALAALPERGAGRQAAFEDLFWALLNSSEFVFNH
jgi:hypothetical protein